VVEQIFGLPGLGAATVQAIGDNDLPMVQGWCCSPPSS
jgi:ABC-type dipeptide/oligopeptide/nickel transport system permease component